MSTRRRRSSGEAAVPEEGRMSGKSNGGDVAPDVEDEGVAMAPPPKRARTKTPSKSTKEAEKAESSTDGLSLFEAISSKSASLVTALDQWRTLYRSSKAKGILALVNTVLQASGNAATITEQLFSAFEADQETWPQVAAHVEGGLGAAEGQLYPLIDKSPSNRSLKRNISTFATKLVVQCGQDGILYDNYLLPMLVLWLSSLSQHVARPLRHTASFMMLQVKAALIQEAARIRAQEEMNTRQLRAEKRKGKKADREADLAETTDRLRDQRSALEDAMNDIYENIYAHRSRDQDALIRSECQQALASWVRDYPAVYRNNTYVRNLGWALSDRAPEVRLVAAQQLATFFDDAESVEAMSAFFGHFRPRIVRLAEDKSAAVAVAGLRLCTLMAQRGLLQSNEVSELCGFVSDYDARIRDAAAAFVSDYVLELAVPREVGERRTRESAEAHTERIRVEQLRAILGIVAASPHPALPDYLVDALFDKSPVLKYWSSMVALIRGNELAENEHVLLSKLLLAAVQCTNSPNIVGKASEIRRQPRPEALRVEAAAALCPHLATLLAEQTDPQVLAALISVAPLLPPDVWADLRHEEELTALLGHVARHLLEGREAELIDAAATTFVQFAKRVHKQQSEAEGALDELLRGLWEQLEAARDAEGETDAFILPLTRLGAVSREYDVGARLGGKHDELERTLVPLLIPSAPTELLAAALALQQFTFMWHVAALAQNPDRRSLALLSGQRDNTFAALELLLEGEDHRVPVFKATCELLVLFNPNLRQSPIAQLAAAPSDPLVQHLKAAFHAEMAVQDTEQSEEEEEDDQTLLSLHKGQLIGALGRLVLAGALPGGIQHHAPDILLHFAAHGKAVAGYIRAFHQRLRSQPELPEYLILFETLRRKYEESRETGHSQPLEALANRLSLTFGVATQRSETMRRVMGNLIVEVVGWVAANVAARQAILSAVAPTFLNRIDVALGKLILKEFDKHMEGADLEDAAYSTLKEFRDALSVAAGEATKTKRTKKLKAGATPEEEPATKRVRGSKSVLPQGEEEAEERVGDVLAAMMKKPGRGRKSAARLSQEPEVVVNQDAMEEDEAPKKRGRTRKLVIVAPASAPEEEEENELEEEVETPKEKKGGRKRKVEVEAEEEEQPDEEHTRKRKRQKTSKAQLTVVPVEPLAPEAEVFSEEHDQAPPPKPARRRGRPAI